MQSLSRQAEDMAASSQLSNLTPRAYRGNPWKALEVPDTAVSLSTLGQLGFLHRYLTILENLSFSAKANFGKPHATIGLTQPRKVVKVGSASNFRSG